MGGIPDPVGVVRKQEAGAGAEAVVAAPNPARRRRYVGVAWESSFESPVPASMRTYLFSWVDGGISVMEQRWHIKRDEYHKVEAVSATDAENPNPQGFPVMTFEQAKRVVDTSRAEDVPLNLAFVKVMDTEQYSPAVLEKIALSPECYVKPSVEVERKQSDKAKAAEFWKKVKASK